MPHPRNRLILDKLQKRMKFFPILALQGARQTGKSFLVRELLKGVFKKSFYLSFDNESDAERAKLKPRTFLEDYLSFEPLIIDEAQKVSKIFDAIKFSVDQDRRPGRYLLLGSTEFSLFNQIRESLTGRMGRIRLFPMTLRETLDQTKSKSFQPKRRELLQYLRQGGMPGFFATNDLENRNHLIQDWINLVCYRDLMQFKKLKLDPTLALKILSLLATLPEPNIPSIVRILKKDARRIQTHIKALEELFVIQKLEPHPLSRGKKPIYLILDVGIAEYLGANEERKLHIFLMNERLVYHSIHTVKPYFFYFYQSNSKGLIHWIEEVTGEPCTAHLICFNESIKPQDIRIAEAFLEKNPKSKAIGYAPILNPTRVEKINVLPWEAFCI